MNNMLSIICSVIIFIFPYIGRRWFNRQTLSSTVMSFGLLGTFSGIMYGLWIFGVDTVNESIPQLLEGLKIAFLTSITGMVSSLLLKLCPAFYGIKKEEQAEEDFFNQQLINVLTEIKTNTGIFSSITPESFPSHSNDKITEQINNSVTQIYSILENQQQSMLRTQQINEQLQRVLENLVVTQKNTELFLTKTTSLNYRQNEAFHSQLSDFGNFIKTTEEHFENQIGQMEERYKRELSQIEKTTQTLLLIIKKLTQDHEALYKESGKEN